MLHSSLGFHTMTLSLFLKQNDALPLIKAFGKYSHDTGLIQMYLVDGKNQYTTYHPRDNDNSTFLLPRNLSIKYFKEDKGIKWRLKCNDWNTGFKSYIVEATINPKILAGIRDYITAATYDDMGAAITNFNLMSSRISPLLGTFENYLITRIDYCINFDLSELTLGCPHELIMNLIKRSDIPPHYKEWESYDVTAHRMKSRPGSFYLTNPYVTINCYSKYMKLQEQSQNNVKKGYPPISQNILDAAKNIIRFEVQCKYHKTYSLSGRAKASGNLNYNKYDSLLMHEVCAGEIEHYFKKTIGMGDWYTLQDAVKLIELQHFSAQKTKRLIDALKFVSAYRSLSKAKTAIKGDDLNRFKQTLKDLTRLNINPVTIPKKWCIKHIPNLLDSYYNRVCEEFNKKRREELQDELLKEYIKEFGCLPN